MRLISTIELRRPARKIVPCEYQSNPVAKFGTAEAVIRKPLYRSNWLSFCTDSRTTSRLFRLAFWRNALVRYLRCLFAWVIK
jgi:hypothetical protein